MNATEPVPVEERLHAAKAAAEQADDDDQARREHDGKLLAHIDEIFSYHAPDDAGLAAIARIRDGAKEFAEILYRNVPPCADRTLALQHLRDSMMRANAGVALKGVGLNATWKPR